MTRRMELTRRHMGAIAVSAALLLGGCMTSGGGGDLAELTPAQRALGTAVLPAGDGWGSFGTGTTGGSKAKPENIHLVKTRAELVKALGGDNGKNTLNNTDTIIYVKGTIDLTHDDDGKPIPASAFADPAFNWDAYIKYYDPATYGNSKRAEGPLEEARKRSQENQKKQVIINVGSNKTLVGVGPDARIINGGLMLAGVSNVIIRNISFEDARDDYTAWDPRDGGAGAWNTEYDNIQIINKTTHVWVDHCTFSDGARTDDKEPKVFGQYMLKHDGLLDITNESNYVTVSNNVFRDHGKTNLIGSSDSRTADAAALKVTFRHNLWQNTTERMPRVRFGQVDVYNNYYKANSTHPANSWFYGIGAGVNSKVYSENNYFEFTGDVKPFQIIRSWKGTSLLDKGSMLNGQPVDMVKEWNAFAANPGTDPFKSANFSVTKWNADANKAGSDPKAAYTQLNNDVGWVPTLRAVPVLPTTEVPAYVTKNAGAGKL